MFSSPTLAPQFAKYFISGSTAFATHLAVLVGLVELFGMNATLATALAFCVAVAVNYTIQHRWVFRVSGPHRVMFSRYVAVTVVTFLANILLFRFGYYDLGLWYPLAQAMATGLIFVVNFIINRHYTFRFEG